MRIGPYSLDAELGRGGAGAVFRGAGPDGLPVAVKVLHRGVSAEQRRRFAREAEALLRLDHPGIVRALGAGEADGQPYLAMELVEGRSLDELLDESGPLTTSYAIEIVQQVARALGYAHGLGVLHRDVKPGNILLARDGRVLLSDFGLVHEEGAERSQLTRTGVVLGSPGYWPPEQAQGDRQAMSPRSDVYSLGATLFALLTGRPPFIGDSMVELLVMATSHEPPAPSSLADVDSALDGLVLRCLAKDPEERFPDAGALAEACERYLSLGRPPGSSPGVALGAAAGVGAALALLAGLYLLLPGPPRPEAAPLASEPPPREPPAPAEPPPTDEPGAPEGPTPSAGPSLVERRARNRGEVMARVNQGVIRQQQGDLKGAFADYTAALELDPELADAWANRGTVLEVMGDHEAALLDYEKALRFDPEQARYWSLRGNALTFLGRFPEAISDFNRSLDLDPRQPVALTNRGNAHLNLHQWKEAIADYGRVLALDPHIKQAWLGRAQAKEELKDYAGAYGDYDRAVRIDPNYVPALFGRGLMLLALGRQAEARRDLERFLQLAPDAEPAERVRRILAGNAPF